MHRPSSSFLSPRGAEITTKGRGGRRRQEREGGRRTPPPPPPSWFPNRRLLLFSCGFAALSLLLLLLLLRPSSDAPPFRRPHVRSDPPRDMSPSSFPLPALKDERGKVRKQVAISSSPPAFVVRLHFVGLLFLFLFLPLFSCRASQENGSDEG